VNADNTGIVAASPAMSFVLRHQLHVKNSLGSIKGLPKGKKEFFDKLTALMARTRSDLSVPDKFRSLADTVTMVEAMTMIATERGFETGWCADKITVLAAKDIRTVGDLRTLTPPRIESLGLSPVVTEYLLRINMDREHLQAIPAPTIQSHLVAKPTNQTSSKN
jgi:hypothetical protein